MMSQDPTLQLRNQKIIAELVKRIDALGNDDKVAMWNDAMAWRQTRAANLSNLLQDAQSTVLEELKEEAGKLESGAEDTKASSKKSSKAKSG